ncbi:MAG TPA: ankyrin repeat domain-containing protein [Burkholderiaceae bacterium]|nr:ankyrin repeat domain-containing protein [Burkholderiaceae bacterium]
MVRNLATGLAVCSEGACSNLIIAADDLRLGVHGPRGHAKRAWESLFDQAIVEFSLRTHGNRYNYLGNEIHYVNGYRNYFAHTLGLTERPDSFVQQEEFEPHLEAATRFVNETVTADTLVTHLAESCLAEVREHFKSYLDRPLTETETWECYQKYDSIGAALQSRYGRIECDVLINADESADTEEATFRVINRPDVLMRAIARNLRQAGVLEKEKFKTEGSAAAADDQPGGKIKRITDDAYYVKEQVPGQSHARYRNVQPTDLRRFNLPEERTRRILKNALISTTDRDQLQLLDPSGVWDLITNPEGGLVEETTQWLDVMVHSAVKRYREASADANQFLMVKAKEKLSRNESPVQERHLADLMINGEDALAAAAASWLTTFDWFDRDGNGVLHIAARMGCHQVLEELAPRALDINEQNWAHQTPLMLAVEAEATPCVHALLKHGANSGLRNGNGATALMIAANRGALAIVETLLDHGADADLQDRNGWSALHFAAVDGDPDLVQRLAKAVKDVNQVRRDGQTPLMIAAGGGHVEAVRRLLDLKANAGHKDARGRNAFHIAAKNGETEVLKALKPFVRSVDERTPAGMTALMLAAQHAHAEAVRTLLSFDADADLTNRLGQNALHFAAIRGEPDSIEALGKVVKDVNQVAHGRLTALMMAADQGRVAAVRALLNCKAKADLKASSGMNAFHMAAKAGRHEVLEELKSFVELDARTADGDTALLLAAWGGHSEAVDMLLRFGADPNHLNVLDKNGRTPLMQAAKSGRWNVVKGLVHAGATIHCPDQDGVTPWMAANQSNAPEEVLALLCGGNTSASSGPSGAEQRTE